MSRIRAARVLLADCLLVAGCSAVVVGMWWLDPRLCLVVGGVAAVVAGLLIGRA